MPKKEDTGAARKNHVSGQSNKPLTRPAHALEYASLISEIKANPDDGLTADDARSRLEDYGRNEIGDHGGVNITKILITQMANAMVLILILGLLIAVPPFEPLLTS